MSKKRFIISIALVFAALLTVAKAQTNTVGRVESKVEHDRRMAWWRQAKFGLFIHWGVYSVPAGIYHGKPVPAAGEWIMNIGKIPMAQYQPFAKRFAPTNFNADEWVKIARDAGMKYIVITSKHHDGFAMFPSQASQWNIYDATPWHHDPLQELAGACRRQGVKLGFYYSQAQDWNNGGSAMGGKWDPAQKHDMDNYIDKIAVPQVKEICSNYGPDVPAVLWWDTSEDMNFERAKKLYDVVAALKPDIIMNNRLGGGFKGDTETPEQRIPAQGSRHDWETCMTINDTWGYKRDDDHWKSSEFLIRSLCDIASKGGNFLLNVGPNSLGEIPQPEVDRLEAIGQWMKVNGQAIYGTTASPPFPTELGQPIPAKDGYGHETTVSSDNVWRCTTKPGKLYLILFNWPTTGKFELPGLQSQVNRAFLLANHQKLKFHQTDAGLTLDLPAATPRIKLPP